VVLIALIVPAAPIKPPATHVPIVAVCKEVPHIILKSNSIPTALVVFQVPVISPGIVTVFHSHVLAEMT
jgi:hypothetical protein